MVEIDNKVSEKLLECKKEKSRYISNILNGEKLYTDKGYEVDSLDKLKDSKYDRKET